MRLRKTSLVLTTALMALATASVVDSVSARGGRTRVILSYFPRSTPLTIPMRSARLRAAQPNQSPRGRLNSGRPLGGVLLSTGDGTSTVARTPSSQAMRGANGFGRSGMSPRGMGGRR
jgi:hypothetical protein